VTVDSGTTARIERTRLLDSAVWTMNALATGAGIVAAVAWLFALAAASGPTASHSMVVTVGIACTATVCLVLFLLARHLITLQRQLEALDD
jgi:hypothetical protein